MAEQVYGQISTDSEAPSAIITGTTLNPGTIYGNGATAQDLLDNGPKNELFLYADQTVTFKVKTNREMQIGLKAPLQGQGTAFELKVNDAVVVAAKDINTSVDMFYPLVGNTTNVTEYTVSVKNTGNGILSVTDLKICDDPGAAFVPLNIDNVKQILLDAGVENDEVPVADGWVLEESNWYYYRNGEKLTAQWLKDGAWYYLDVEGVMVTGWAKTDGKWYYFNDYGAMQTGWKYVDGKWYYLKSEMKTGWQYVGGIWYYLGTDGAMRTGWQYVGGVWYYLNSNGAMQTGWQNIGGKWYYLASNGAMQTGWIRQAGKWYYLNPTGEMVTGEQTIGGKSYSFDANGVWIA